MFLCSVINFLSFLLLIWLFIFVKCDKKERKACDSGCHGGLMTNAYRYLIRAGGLQEESSYPYVGKKGECNFDPEKIAVRVVNFTNIPIDEKQIAAHLVNRGPLAGNLNELLRNLWFIVTRCDTYGTWFCSKCSWIECSIHANIHWGCLVPSYLWQEMAQPRCPSRWLWRERVLHFKIWIQTILDNQEFVGETMGTRGVLPPLPRTWNVRNEHDGLSRGYSSPLNFIIDMSACLFNLVVILWTNFVRCYLWMTYKQISQECIKLWCRYLCDFVPCGTEI